MKGKQDKPEPEANYALSGELVADACTGLRDVCWCF